MRGRPEQCLRQLDEFDFDEDEAAPTYSPHNVLELKLTQASALTDLGLNCEAQIRFVRRQGHRQRTRLRPVFTEHIAPFVLARKLTPVVATLGARTSSTPAGLDHTTEAVLAAGSRAASGRPIWVD